MFPEAVSCEPVALWGGILGSSYHAPSLRSYLHLRESQPSLHLGEKANGLLPLKLSDASLPSALQSAFPYFSHYVCDGVYHAGDKQHPTE